MTDIKIKPCPLCINKHQIDLELQKIKGDLKRCKDSNLMNIEYHYKYFKEARELKASLYEAEMIIDIVLKCYKLSATFKSRIEKFLKSLKPKGG